MNDMIITDKQVKQILRNLVVTGVQAPGGLAITDLGMTVRFVNPMWAAMHGYNTTDELVGKHISIFHTKEQMEADVTPFMEEAEHRNQLAGPIGHLRSNGTIFGTRTKFIPVRDEQGNVIALVVLAADTTRNNADNHYLTDQSIEPIIVTNDELQQNEFQQQPMTQGAISDSQAIEASTDIKTEHKKQLADAKAETEQAITEQVTGANEFLEQAIEGKTEAEPADERTRIAAEPEEISLRAEDIEQVQSEPELQKPIRDDVGVRAIIQTEKQDCDENPANTVNNANAPQAAEERTNVKPDSKARHERTGKTGIYASSGQPRAGQDLSEVLVKESSGETSLRDACYVFFRHKWKMVLFFFTVVAVTAAVTSVCAKVYRSEAKLLLRLGHESVTLDPTAATGQIVSVLQSRENEINSELEILRSQELIEKVVDSVGPPEFLKSSIEKHSSGDSVLRAIVSGLKSIPRQFDLAESVSDRDKAILTVAKNLKIENLKDSSIISISYEAGNPKLAQEVVSKLIDLHLERHIEIHRTLGSREFFDQQVNQLRDKLTQSETELMNLKNQTGVSSVAEQQRVVMSRIGTLKQEIDQTDAALASSVAAAEALQQTMTDVPKTIVTEETTGFPNLSADEMRKQLFERQLEELKLMTSFTDESITVKAIHKEIAEAQALLAKEEPNLTQVTRGISKAYEQLESALLTEKAAITSLRAKSDAQKKQLVDAQAELKNLNDAEAKITSLTRETSVQDNNYRKYSESLEQARINFAMDNERISNIRVVQAATLPIKAIKPNKLVDLTLGLILGILGAIVLAIFSEHLDHSIKTPEEAEEMLQLPALASIPRVRMGRVFPKVKSEMRAKTNRETGEKPAKLETPAKIREPYEAFMERLLLNSNGSACSPYVLAVTGCRRNEGVSAVAANIAATISRHHKNEYVLLVDANFIHPSVHKIFNTKLAPGLTDILTNGNNHANTIQLLPKQNVHILSAGILNGNFAEAFNSDKFTKLLTSMKKHYRFVVIDIPPLNEASSAARMAGLCDGTVLVVAAERLRREVMQRAKTQLMESNANILGVVLNKRRFHIPGWLYRRL